MAAERRAGRIDVLWKTDIPLKPFWLAVRTQDLAGLSELCQGKVLPTFAEKQEENHLLVKAMGLGVGVPVLQLLVDHGVDPQSLPKKGYYSPLMQAVSSGNLEHLDFMLGLGVDPNNGLLDQRVTLSAVGSVHTIEKQIQLLDRLVRQGADLNFLFPLFGDTNKLFTLLDHAKHDEVQKMLKEWGAKSAKEITS